MDTTPENVILISLTSEQDVLLKQRSEWCGDLLKDFRIHRGIFEDYYNGVKSLTSENINPNEYWKSLSSALDRILDWNERCSRLVDRYRLQEFWADADQAFEKITGDFPDMLEVPVEKSDWEPRAGDQFKTAAWKWTKRSIEALESLTRNLVNKIRPLFKKQPLPAPPQPSRIIDLNPLIKRFLHIPFQNFLLREWQDFMRHTARIYYDFHLLSNKLKEDQLLMDDHISICSNEDSTALSRNIDIVKAICGEIEEKISKFETETGLLPAQFNDFKEKITGDFLKIWESAGTSLLPSSRYSKQALEVEQSALKNRFDESKLKWNRHFIAESDEWKKSLELSQLQLKAVQCCIILLDHSRKRIEEHIIPAFVKSRDFETKTLEKIKTLKIAAKAKVMNALSQEKRTLLKGLNQEKTLLLVDKVMQTQLKNDFHQFYSALESWADMIPEKQALFTNRNFDRLVPEPKTEYVPTKELADIYGLQVLKTANQDFLTEIDAVLNRTLRTLSMIDQIVEFNFETAVNLLHSKQRREAFEQAKQTIVEALERTVGQFTDLINDNQAFVFKSREKILEMTLDFHQAIQELESSEKVFELKIKLARAKTRERMRDYRKSTANFVGAVFSTALKTLKETVNRMLTGFQRLRKITGMEVKSERFEDEVIRLVAAVYSPIDRLPIVYQRLFQIQALTDERFFAERQSEFAALQEEYLSWQRDPVSATVLVGEKGSGKTTLLNYAKNELYYDYKLNEMTTRKTVATEKELFAILKNIFAYDDVESIDELEAKILEESEQRVVICENLQRYFVRIVDGFSALQRFLLFITKTSSKVYWVTSCSLYSWQYLDKVISLSKYFHRIIHMERLSIEEMESIILLRHRTSGFNLFFNVPYSIAKTGKFKKLPNAEEQQTYVKKLLFKDLNNTADGNIAVAMMFWLIAIEEVRKDELVIKPVLYWDDSIFQKMVPDDLFTLAAVIQQDGINAEEHAAVFHQDVSKSHSVLTRLKNNGILVEADSLYFIRPVLYRPIVNALQSKNIIH